MTRSPSLRAVSRERSRAECGRTRTSAAIPSNEAEARLDVEPLDRACLLYRQVSMSAWRRGSRTRSRWCHRVRGACINAQDLGNVWSLVSRPNADFEGFTWLHGVDAALRQHAPVEEGVAGHIREFDKVKSLLRTEPFYDATDRRTGGWFEPSLAEPGSGAESTGLRLVVVVVEFATPRMTKILRFAHRSARSLG